MKLFRLTRRGSEKKVRAPFRIQCYIIGRRLGKGHNTAQIPLPALSDPRDSAYMEDEADSVINVGVIFKQSADGQDRLWRGQRPCLGLCKHYEQ